jgi:hypothetical protein
MTDSTNNPAEIRAALERDQEAEDQALNTPANAVELPASERTAFEAACRAEDREAFFVRRRDGTYVDPELGSMWWAWQARAALSTQPAPARVALTNVQDRKDAERYRSLRRKICFTGNGDGTSSMHAINLPDVVGFPSVGKQLQFIDAAIDSIGITASNKEGHS